VDLLAHPIAHRRVDQLVLLDARQPVERRGNNQCLPVRAVAGDLDVFAGQACGDRLLDGFGRDHDDFPG